MEGYKQYGTIYNPNAKVRDITKDSGTLVDAAQYSAKDHAPAASEPGGSGIGGSGKGRRKASLFRRHRKICSTCFQSSRIGSLSAYDAA